MERKTKKRIHESLQAKTFLTMLGLLVFCCAIIYGMVIACLPQNYRTELKNQFIMGFQDLIQVLEVNGIENSTEKMNEFTMQNHASVSILSTEGKEVLTINNVTEDINSDKSEKITSSANFEYNGKGYAISAEASLVAVSQSYEILIKLIPLILFVILAISMAGAYFCSRYFSKPIIDICNVAKRIAELDMTWKCETNRKDEMGILAESLNKMSKKLNNTLSSLQAANEKLQQDIEKERKQEKQRIEFFTAVSHELKTPVTRLKGRLECVIYNVGEEQDREKYLFQCIRTVDEIEKLISEILLAAQMGNSNFQMTANDLSISKLIIKCCEKVQGTVEDKEMKMQLNIQPDVHFCGDKYLLEKVFSNIIGNAVVYSPIGAAVNVYLERGFFSVENTGVHIDKNDLEQIFIPFYRIDKSRNRNTGGSGLGLYIVKTVLEHHHLPYYIENTKSGVRFCIKFLEHV